MKKIIPVLSLTLLLCACGGGGGDSAPAPVAAPTAEGIWQGTTTSGPAVNLAILDNGETWGYYASGNVLVGALYGTTVSSGTDLSGSGRDFSIASRTTSSGTYKGTFSAKNAISVTTSGGVSFTGKYNADYDKAATLSSIAGTFTGVGVTGTTASQSLKVNIAATGVITVPATLACAASGTASVRPGGKNIFDLALTFTGSSCALGNGAVTKGIAFYDAPNRQLLAMAMNTGKTDGFIFAGQQ